VPVGIADDIGAGLRFPAVTTHCQLLKNVVYSAIEESISRHAHTIADNFTRQTALLLKGQVR
jgi:hypothetical protein|tara:strand:- start:2312 stop:2497 length:186 start_codon:yes stop_codon:yes gene_type:complete